jgi:peptide/nickel transport system permease protein
MLFHIVKRMIFGVLSVFGVLVLVFFLARLTGDPTSLYLPQNATQEARDAFRTLHHLDQPVWQQFGIYLRDLAHFDFGNSMLRQRPAMESALEAFPNTLKIAFVSLAIAIASALVVGSLAAYRPGGLFDRLSTFFSLIGASAPDFWVAIVGVLVFSVALRWLPTSGTGGLSYWVMPVAVLSLRPFGLLVQVVRGSMMSALSSAYVKTAQAKGVHPRSIIFRHALRNSMLPVITVAGDLAASVVNGAVVVETVFGWPGIGKLTIDAITQRDFPILQACVLVTAIAVFFINVVVDILYSALDPRVRTQ